MATKTVAERLADNSTLMPNGCREWQLARSPDGYGLIKIAGKQHRAHVASCLLANGAAPSGKTLALHRCDNPPCVEGSHPYWGSQKDNMRDRVERGRWKGGRRRKRPCIGHEFTPRSNGSCKHCRREYGLS